MGLKIKKVELGEKPILRNLMEYYEYDFSIYTQRDVNSSGTFEYKYLDNYWTEQNRFPFFIILDKKLIGFALIRKIESDNYFSVAEFFILKKYRRKGLGLIVANKLFDMFSGTWKVHQHKDNLIAQKFWEKVINLYTKGNYESLSNEESDVDGPCQIFNN